MKTVSLLLLSAATLVWQHTKDNLPAPFATPTVKNGPNLVAKPDGAKLKVPQGFVVEEFAAGFQRPRFMVEGPGGEVLISDTVANGFVYVLKDGQRKTLIEKLDRPYGLAFWKDYLYVGEPTSIKRYTYDSKAMTVGVAEEVVAMPGYTSGHVTRTIVFNRKGDRMFVAVGSSGDLVEGDPEMRAAINSYTPDGKDHKIVSTGLRNPVGLRMYPGTDQLWATVEERNDLGDGLVADFFTSVKPGGFYGWPYAYLGKHPDPRIKNQRMDLVGKTLTPDVVLEPHVAVLDFLFYAGGNFPADYKGGAFLANHGSSNRSTRTGYSVSFVPFKNGKPSGPVRDFLTGFMMGADQKDVWGRPVGLMQMKDGSLLVSDDGGKTLWRVSYQG